MALNRVFGLNKKSVEEYFSNLKGLLHTHDSDPHHIFNWANLCSQTVKVVAPKGKYVNSGERGQTTTIINAMNAAGMFVPPPPVVYSMGSSCTRNFENLRNSDSSSPARHVQLHMDTSVSGSYEASAQKKIKGNLTPPPQHHMRSSTCTAPHAQKCFRII